jgi:hypothetical protein
MTAEAAVQDATLFKVLTPSIDGQNEASIKAAEQDAFKIITLVRQQRKNFEAS